MGMIKAKSRTLRRVKVRTSTRLALHYEKKKPKKARCSVNGMLLSGVARGNQVDISRLAKTKRRPQRPYGGCLSSRAMRELIIRKTRSKIENV